MDRDFDKEKIVDKMRELRDKRDLELMNEQPDETENENKVIDVKYLGQLDTIGDIYLIIEQDKDKEGNLIEIERYCTEDGEVIGGNNKSDNYDFILLSEQYKDRQELLEQLQSLDKEGILDLNQIEEERLESIAKELGIKKEELEEISEIESEEEIDKDENSKDDEEKEELSKEEVESISTKTEINVNQKVTDRETISSLLKVQDKGYKKIAVVYSDKLQDGGNNTRFSFVGIKEDGSAEKIDTLEQRYGNDPTKKIDSLNRDGSEIEEKQVQSIYQIKGDNENQVAVNIGEMGVIEASYVRTPRQDNQEAISIPIETHSVKPTTRETRELMNRQRNPDVKEETQRIQMHKEVGCDKETIKDIDDNPENNTHEHEEQIDEKYIQYCVEEVLKSDEVANVYNRDDVRRILLEKIQNKEYISNEELIEETTEQMEETAQNERTHENNRR